MISKNGNLFNEIVILVQGRYGVIHVAMNSTGVGVVVGDKDRTVSGEGWIGCDETEWAGVGRGQQ